MFVKEYFFAAFSIILWFLSMRFCYQLTFHPERIEAQSLSMLKKMPFYRPEYMPKPRSHFVLDRIIGGFVLILQIGLTLWAIYIILTTPDYQWVDADASGRDYVDQESLLQMLLGPMTEYLDIIYSGLGNVGLIFCLFVFGLTSYNLWYWLPREIDKKMNQSSPQVHNDWFKWTAIIYLFQGLASVMFGLFCISIATYPAIPLWLSAISIALAFFYAYTFLITLWKGIAVISMRLKSK